MIMLARTGYVPVMSESQPPDRAHQVPDGVSQETVDAVGKLTKALETAERARGHLYAFHQLIGEADRRVEKAVRLLREAGHAAWADRLDGSSSGGTSSRAGGPSRSSRSSTTATGRSSGSSRPPRATTSRPAAGTCARPG